jgi:hypothetical protein
MCTLACCWCTRKNNLNNEMPLWCLCFQNVWRRQQTSELLVLSLGARPLVLARTLTPSFLTSSSCGSNEILRFLFIFFIFVRNGVGAFLTNQTKTAHWVSLFLFPRWQLFCCREGLFACSSSFANQIIYKANSFVCCRERFFRFFVRKSNSLLFRPKPKIHSFVARFTDNHFARPPPRSKQKKEVKCWNEMSVLHFLTTTSN